MFSDKNGQIIFFTPIGKALGQVPIAREVSIAHEVASSADVAYGAAVSPADAGGFSTAPPTWRHDRDIPWSIEAAAWEALDAGGT